MTHLRKPQGVACSHVYDTKFTQARNDKPHTNVVKKNTWRASAFDMTVALAHFIMWQNVSQVMLLFAVAARCNGTSI